jgi:TRAP-type mannitol/chloroaromatic compound transport system permease large subunit
MAQFLAANMAPIMFASLFLFLLIGFPIAFSLAALGLFYGLVGIELGLLTPALFQALPERIFGIMRNETLLAIPFFTFMGFIFDRSGMAEELLETIGRLFGSVRGGIGYAVIVVGAILGGPAGVVAATVISMGMISLPVMLRYGYSRPLAAGTIAASGTLAQIIPPSIVLVVLADTMGKSVGDLYIGAWFPSFVLVGLYMLYVWVMTVLRPDAAPALPPEAQLVRTPEPWLAALRDHLPALAIALGTIVLWKHGLLGKRGAFFLALAAGWVWTFVHARRHGLTLREAGVALSSGLFFVAVAVGIELLDVGMSDLVDALWPRLQAFGVGKDMWTLAFLALLAFPLVWLQKSIGRVEHAKVMMAMVPQLVLLFLVLGTILLGLATPTEGGAMGAAGTLLMAWLRGRVNRDVLTQAVDETAKLTSFVIFVLVGATVFGLTFRGVNGDLWVEHLLTRLPGGQVGFLVAVNALVFVLAFFLDFFEIAFILVPLLAPVADKMGIDLVWFGVILAMNMQTSFMHPPFGFSLMYLRSVAPSGPYRDSLTGRTLEGVKTTEIYWGAIPYVLIQLLTVAIVIVFPQLAMVYKGDAAEVDSSKVKIEVQEVPPSGGAGEQDRELQQMFEKPGTGAPAPSAPEPVDPLERALREQERRDSK